MQWDIMGTSVVNAILSREMKRIWGRRFLDKEYKKMSKDPEPGIRLACLKNSMVSRVAITFVWVILEGRFEKS